MQSWENANTGEIVHGSFLAARSVDGVTRVSIEREDGDVVEFAMEELSPEDQAQARRRISEVKAINEQLLARSAAAQRSEAPGAPSQAAPFDVFAPFVSTRWDERWLYVESDGLPHLPGTQEGLAQSDFSHPLMVGITAWQQQVPLPQQYQGANAWQIPLKPELAETIVSAKEQLFRGAIALAANGVPIFNPIKNDGITDTLLAGELDEFGGHCGRADDYHYHIAPTHLQEFVGEGQPIAYALDGFPIYGLFDPDAKSGEQHACPLGSLEQLDNLNGHFASASADAAPGSQGLYHYHASEHYPYLNGGMRGKVTVNGDQIEPQPRTTPVRDWLQPMRGAKITGFHSAGKDGENAWSLEYTIGGKQGLVNYSIDGQGEAATYDFEFVSPDGTRETATYSASQQDRRNGERGQGGEGRPRRDDNFEARPSTNEPASVPAASGFELTSPDVSDGRLSIDCTCEGEGHAPSLQWGQTPEGTEAFAVVMHHIAPDDETHVYMVVANLPASSRALSAGSKAVGVWGPNTVNHRNEYTPPCSKGPGDKMYTITLYALSAQVEATEGELSRDALLAKIEKTTLATATLDVQYARLESGAPEVGQPPIAEPRGWDREEGRGDSPRNGAQQRDREHPSLLARMTAFKTDVPEHDINVILVRPTDHSVLVTVALGSSGKAGNALVEFWDEESGFRQRTDPVALNAGEVARIELSGLSPETEYQYRVGVRHDGPNGAGEPDWVGNEGRFRTKPDAGTDFVFTIQADSHLDQSVEPKVYEQTLANMLAESPDFVVDLGDTFMTDKRGRNFQSALPQYDAQRYYLSLVAHSAPLFMVLGNHDGEKGTSGRDSGDIGPWSYSQRTSRFPEPIIDGLMYTGATGMKNGTGSNYYAFEWGDALIVVLDPFWSTTERTRGGMQGARTGGDARGQDTDPLEPTDASWATTLGREQYHWLDRTLNSTQAKYRFVFIHHLVGGIGGNESRGGVESSVYFEWGGHNADGTPGFAEHRPGWPMPIHDLLVKHKVSAVFHGHDHLYVHSERDGIQYQCVPQPGNPAGNTRTAAEYGYESGKVLGSPGHLLVRVTPESVMVDFVRTAIDDDADEPQRRRRGGEAREGGEPNSTVVDTYELVPVPDSRSHP